MFSVSDEISVWNSRMAGSFWLKLNPPVDASFIDLSVYINERTTNNMLFVTLESLNVRMIHINLYVRFILIQWQWAWTYKILMWKVHYLKNSMLSGARRRLNCTKAYAQSLIRTTKTDFVCHVWILCFNLTRAHNIRHTQLRC